jgi:hypothetical protein
MEQQKSSFLEEIDSRIAEAEKEPSPFEKLKMMYKDLNSYPSELTVSSLLSSTDAFKKMYELQASLSASCLGHPYNQYKAKYLDPSKTLTTLEQLPPPKCRSILKLRDQLVNVSRHHTNNLLTQLPLVSATPEKNLAAAAMLFSSLSGDQVVTNQEKMREHFEFIELLKTMTAEDIEIRPITTALKIVNEFIRVYSPDPV